MQHGESGAPLPRALSRQYGKQLCHQHNSEKRGNTSWLNQQGRPLDTTGTFTVVRRQRKVIKPPTAE